MRILFVFLAALVIAGQAFAGAKSWDGGAGTSNWHDANNWSPDGVPNSTNDVTITTNTPQPIISADAACRALTINTGATLTQNSSTLSVDRDWTNNGTFTANGGTVDFSRSGNQDINGATTFNNLSLSGSGTKTAQAALTVKGNLTIATGVTFSAGTFTHNLKGNWSNSGTFNAGTSTFVMNGTSAQTMSGSTFNNLTIDNSAGVTLLSDETVSGTLTLTSGVLNTGSNKIVISNDQPGAVVIPTTAGSITGTIQRVIAAGNTGTYKFTNTNTLIQPATGQSAVTFTVTSHPGEYPPFAPSGTAINRYYVLSPSATFTADAVRLEYLSSENINSIPKPNMTLFRRDATLLAWINEGGAHALTTELYVELGGGVSQWSEWTIGDGLNPLPITLASFTGTVIENNRVRLEWRTISEINNYGFYVQRRTVGVQEWTEIPNSFVPGHGTTNEPQYYTYTDPTPITTSTQYRLKQVDLDGTTHYTDPIQVDLPTGVPEVAPREFTLKQNYPNPFNPSTAIKFSVETTDRATLEVYNTLGQKVATLFDGVAEAGQYYTVQFNGSGLSSGVYFYRLESGKRSDLKKLVLLK